jgi:transcriptional regulator with XRE-family HTH domain
MSKSADELRKQLRDMLKPRGPWTQKTLAANMGISPQYLGDFLHGKRGPGDSICKYLGVREMITYIPRQQIIPGCTGPRRQP